MMKCLMMLFLAAALPSIANSLLLGSQKCTYGPSYWCASFANAKECSATQHCLTYSWQKLTHTKSLEDKLEETTCQLCKDIVNDTHKFIADPGTRGQLLQYLSQACGYMPDTFSKQECNKIATHYLDEVLALVETAVDPDIICALLKLCGGTRTHSLDLIPRKSPNKFIATIAASTIQKTAVEHSLGSQKCTYGPSYWCASFANAKECSATQHCIQNNWQKRKGGSKLSIGVQEETVCTLCKNVVGDIHKFVADNGTWEEALDFLDGRCDRCPDTFARAECKKIAEHYLDEVLQAVEAAIDPETVCSLLWLCSNNTALNSPYQKVKANVIQDTAKENPVHSKECLRGPSYWCDSFASAKECSTIDYCTTRHWKKRTSATKGDQSESVCTLCQKMIGDVYDFVADNGTREQIVEYLDEACENMPDSFSQKECEKITTHYLDEILTAVEADIDPEEICYKLWLCWNKTSNLLPVETSIQPKEDETVCALCKNIVGELRNFIINNQNETEALVLYITNALCHYAMPDNYSTDLCERTAKHYLEQLLTELEDAVDPTVICKKYNLCLASKRRLLLSSAQLFKKENPKETVCTLCEDLVGDVHDFVANNVDDVEKAVQPILDDICEYAMPDDFSKNECQQATAHYMDVFFTNVENALNPTAVCSNAMLCANTGKSIVLTRPSTLKTRLDETVCTLCKDIAGDLDKFLSNVTSDQVVALVESELCPLFQDFSAECKTLVEQYVPELWKELLVFMQPDTLCTTLGMCNASAIVEKSSTVQCVFCEFVLSKFDGKTTNKMEIAAAVGSVCTLMPSPLREDCGVFMGKFGIEISRLLLGNVAPDRVCSLDGLKGLGMCPRR